MDEKHELERKQERYRVAKARVFGAEMELNRALAWVSPEDRRKVDHLIYGYTLDHNTWRQRAA